ncbi:hypothetical protein DFH11DRAFT_1655323 [Phellopilus nigrolimitatus]|nr:hypothetical protein DFH11DRAFT_1655323 [Phellopilus nigrolimitatus]
MLPTDSQRIRISLAFITLRYKPKDQSTDVYLLDLRSRFPLRGEADVSCNRLWRERAVALEEEVKTLKRKFEGDLAELAVFRLDATMNEKDATSKTPPGSVPLKKKKRKTNAVCSESKLPAPLPALNIGMDLRNVLEESYAAEINLPELNDSVRIFSSYRKLLCASVTEGSPTNVSVSLISSAIDVVRALGNALLTVVHSQQKLRDPLDVIKGVNAILLSTLSCVFSAIRLVNEKLSGRPVRPSSRKHDFVPLLDQLFNTLTSDFVAPLIKSINQLSRNFLSSTLHEVQSRRKRHSEVFIDSRSQLDIRPSLLTTLGSILSMARDSVVNLRHLYMGLVNTVMISAVAEISRLWSPAGYTPSALTKEQTIMAYPNKSRRDQLVKLSHQQRMERLARKDTLWYMGAVVREALFSEVLSRTGCSTNCTTPTMLIAEEKIEDILSKLLVRCTAAMYPHPEPETRSIREMCEVEKGMVMGIIEKAWLGDFCKCVQV